MSDSIYKQTETEMNAFHRKDRNVWEKTWGNPTKRKTMAQFLHLYKAKSKNRNCFPLQKNLLTTIIEMCQNSGRNCRNKLN